MNIKEVIETEKKLKHQIGDIFKVIEPMGGMWNSKNNILFIQLYRNKNGFLNWIRTKEFIKSADEAGGNNIYRVILK